MLHFGVGAQRRVRDCRKALCRGFCKDWGEGSAKISVAGFAEGCMEKFEQSVEQRGGAYISLAVKKAPRRSTRRVFTT